MNKDVLTWRLKQLRKEQGLTQDALAEIAGYKRNTVSTWERGTRVPDYPALCKLSEIFNVSIAYLLGETPIREIIKDETSEERIHNEGAYPQWKELFERIPLLSNQSQELIRNTAEFLLRNEGLI